MPKWLRRAFDPYFAAWIGVLAPLYTIASIGVSIALSPWFNWTQNALSDLGVSHAAPLFNSGLIVGGILSSIFSIALARAERQSPLCLGGALILLLAGASLSGVGIFPESFGRLHFYFSLAFFVSLILSSIVLGIGFAMHRGTRFLGALSLSVGALGILSWTTIRLPGVAIPEALSAFPADILLIALSLRLGGEKRREEKRREEKSPLVGRGALHRVKGLRGQILPKAILLGGPLRLQRALNILNGYKPSTERGRLDVRGSPEGLAGKAENLFPFGR